MVSKNNTNKLFLPDIESATCGVIPERNYHYNKLHTLCIVFVIA